MRARCSRQQRSIADNAQDNPCDHTLVPQNLLQDCETHRKAAVTHATRKATNLYRRVSALHYLNANHRARHLHGKHSGVKCLVCQITLVKSSKDKRRAGIKLRCQCNARVCTTCFANNPGWYLADPHYTNCSTVKEFSCSACYCFSRIKEKICCSWTCSSCSVKMKKKGSCSLCSKVIHLHSKVTVRSLWAEPKLDTPDENESDAYNEADMSGYKDYMRAAVLERVKKNRHLSKEDITTLFEHTSSDNLVCTCSGQAAHPLCPRCTPVLTVIKLIEENPTSLFASIAERIIPGRHLSRHVYNRKLLLAMLNDPRLPLCPQNIECKGTLIPDSHGRALSSLLSPSAYRDFVSSNGTMEVQACCCILCLLFNQSAAMAQSFSAKSLTFESHPSGPVYYFNIKLSYDIGIPEAQLDDCCSDLTISFQGTVGEFKPTVFYNWRDMLNVLHYDREGNLHISTNSHV